MSGFRRSSHCNSGGCVEVEIREDGVSVRATKRPGEVVAFSTVEWSAFIAGVRAGEFDVPGAEITVGGSDVHGHDGAGNGAQRGVQGQESASREDMNQ